MFAVTSQLCGSSTLFLSKRFLLFQEICIEAGHAAENSRTLSYLPDKMFTYFKLKYDQKYQMAIAKDIWL